MFSETHVGILEGLKEELEKHRVHILQQRFSALNFLFIVSFFRMTSFTSQDRNLKQPPLTNNHSPPPSMLSSKKKKMKFIHQFM
jgi:hypothetical protein